ncbi:facilitated trehalose transporter Tret1-like [Spodoptera frugiperda]|uniref:Facilitated trehalose transporter Tret1-like n=1 Tax=Spodoptera frugiperda TaxID=7108 RepID=A0A9R0EMP0_SPOFR|nr:facilitated trehalose transporter Tret1-like [Spodoptera frugiperda]
MPRIGALFKFSAIFQKQETTWRPGQDANDDIEDYDEQELEEIRKIREAQKAAKQESIIYYDGAVRQYAAGLAGGIGALSAGSNLGWSAPIMVKLDAHYGGYSFPMTKAQGYWMAAVIALGAACACYPIGFVMDAIGRKKTLLSLTVPFLVGWVFVTSANSVRTLLIGRFITGLGGGGLSVTGPVYASEVSQKKMRGSMGSLFQLLLSMGILISVSVRGRANIFVFNCLCTCIPLLFCSIFIFMPESPKYLVMKGRYADARAALVKLRSSKHDVDAELNDIIEKQYTMRKKIAKHPTFCSRLMHKPARRTMLICFTLMLFQQLAGFGIVVISAPRVFKLVGFPLPWTITTLILVFNHLLATLLFTLVIDHVGRRFLLLLSASLMCTCGTIIGTIFWLQEVLDIQNTVFKYVTFLPVICTFVFVYAYALGFGSVPWLMASELCRMDIKAFVMATAATISWFLVFVSNNTVFRLIRIIAIYQMFWIYASFQFTAFFFVYFVVPETKDLSIYDVQHLLRLPLGHVQTRKGPKWSVTVRQKH